MNEFIFTSESVTKGHPDKVSDIISDSILDAYLAKDPTSRVAAETVVKNNTVILVGEISSKAEIDTEVSSEMQLKRLAMTVKNLDLTLIPPKSSFVLTDSHRISLRALTVRWKQETERKKLRQAQAIREWSLAMPPMKRRSLCHCLSL